MTIAVIFENIFTEHFFRFSEHLLQANCECYRNKNIFCGIRRTADTAAPADHPRILPISFFLFCFRACILFSLPEFWRQKRPPPELLAPGCGPSVSSDNFGWYHDTTFLFSCHRRLCAFFLLSFCHPFYGAQESSKAMIKASIPFNRQLNVYASSTNEIMLYWHNVSRYSYGNNTGSLVREKAITL